MSWASVIRSASRTWTRVVQASANLPVFHSMQQGSDTAIPSHAMLPTVFAINGGLRISRSALRIGLLRDGASLGHRSVTFFRTSNPNSYGAQSGYTPLQI